jgi:hypothetical protein
MVIIKPELNADLKSVEIIDKKCTLRKVIVKNYENQLNCYRSEKTTGGYHCSTFIFFYSDLKPLLMVER